MSKNKYYAALFGDGRKEIYVDWPSCKEAVRGAPGILFKGFPTKVEAKAFLDGEAASHQPGIQTPYAIYVDGSYRDGTYSYGFVVVEVKKDVAIHEQYGRGEDAAAAELRNVSGEMKGAMEAVRWCIREGHRSITICYDYTGIECWALGLWKRNNPHTVLYHDFMASRMKDLDLHFHKVKGHSGNRWNEAADALAKMGLNAI